MPAAAPQRHRLTQSQVQFFKENGYLIGLPPVYSSGGSGGAERRLPGDCEIPAPGEDDKEIREWHESSRFLYDICVHPQILDYVEDLLGHQLLPLGIQFFSKAPRHPSVVGWHQDAYYWPLSPHNSVTAWLAFTDSDEGNAAMQRDSALAIGRSDQT